MTYRLLLLGPPELAADDGAVPQGLGPGKPLAVLCYLACEGRTRRDELATMLWGDAGEDRARNAFRQALHRLRTALGDDVVQADRDQVWLAPDAPLRVDLAAFDEALAAGRRDEALALWRGDFLAGFDTGEPAFDHWADGQRARLRGRYQDAVVGAVQAALDAGRPEDAAARAAVLRELAPLDAQAALLEARALAAMGRRSEAAAALRGFQDRYRQELDLDPPAEIVDALAQADPVAAPRTGAGEVVEGPFLREAELGRLLAAWHQAVAGAGQVALVTGETGSGKSRLVRELLARIEGMDPALLLKGAEAAGAGVPYSGIADALRGILGARGLAGASEHLLAEASRLLPELRDRFELPSLAAIDDDTARLRFFEGVAAVLDAVAYERPVCLVLERLEHADRATLDLVFFLASRLRGSPVLFVLAARPSGPAKLLERFAGDRPDAATHVRLEPLPDADLLEMLSATPEGRALPAEERRRVVEHAGGNPLRARELARDLAAGVRPAHLPQTFAAIYRARTEACDPAERRLLLVLALLGRAASLRLLAAATHLSEPATLDAFAALRARGLVGEDARGTYVANDILHEQVLEQAGPAGAALLAGWTADALLAQGGNPGELALLLVRAGRGPAAHEHAMDAGRAAMFLGAWSAAAAWFELAEEHAPDARAQAEASALLAALGGGRPRLAGAPGGTGGGGQPGPDRATGQGSEVGTRQGPEWGTEPHLEPEPGTAEREPARDSRGMPAVRWTRVVAAAITSSVAILAILALLPVVRRPGARATMGTALRDTLVLVRTEADGQETLLGVAGDLDRLPAALPVLRPEAPAWVDSLRDPWTDPLLSPDGRLVAVTHRRPGGAELLVIPADRGDTLPIAGGLDVTAAGWAPDASSLLVIRARHVGTAGVDRDLYAVPVAAPGSAVAIDTSRDRSVEEAAWAPDGVRVAWVARDAGQRDVYVGYADGTDPWNASADPADDDHVTWSPDGRRVAFTSDRGGNADIYAVEVQGRRLWRLTWDAGQDDDASFSPLGDFLAFESTRGADRAVYVMASYGGEPRRVSPPGRPVRPAGWRGAPPPYLDRLLVDAPPVQPGDTVVMEVQGIYTDNVPRNRGSVRWRVLDPGLITLRPDASGVHATVAQRVRVIGVRRGAARVVVSAGGWRCDTVAVRVGG